MGSPARLQAVKVILKMAHEVARCCDPLTVLELATQQYVGPAFQIRKCMHQRLPKAFNDRVTPRAIIDRCPCIEIAVFSIQPISQQMIGLRKITVAVHHIPVSDFIERHSDPLASLY